MTRPRSNGLPFGENAQKLGVDLSAVDLAVLSHGHYDHGGGIALFWESNLTAPVYVSQYAFEPHYNGTDKYIGLDAGLQESRRLISCPEYVRVHENVELFSCNDRTRIYPLDPAGLKVRQGRHWIPEDFRHEQYLLIHEGGKRILFSGCSHRGVLNIMEWFRPDILIGGFHFSKLDPDGDGCARLDQAAETLLQYNCTYYTCHCTGLRQYDYLKQQMGRRLHYLSTGQTLEFH